MMQYLILLYLIEIPVINVNSVDTDQMPYLALFANYLFGGFQTEMD